MTHLASDKVIVDKTPEELFNFLSDFNNFGHLMPEQISDWKSTRDECSFTIKGMASLGMHIKERTPHSSIVIEDSGKSPFRFLLRCSIVPAESDSTANKSMVQLVFDADLNPMLQMMASRPLTNFLNLLVNKLKEI